MAVSAMARTTSSTCCMPLSLTRLSLSRVLHLSGSRRCRLLLELLRWGCLEAVAKVVEGDVIARPGRAAVGQHLNRRTVRIAQVGHHQDRLVESLLTRIPVDRHHA